MSSKLYPEEFKIQAVKQITDRGHPDAEVAGRLVLEAGGDFADGVIAYEESWLSGETAVSFEKKRL